MYVLKHKGIQSTVFGLVWFGSCSPEFTKGQGSGRLRDLMAQADFKSKV